MCFKLLSHHNIKCVIMNNISNSDRLGKDPIKKLLLRLSIPATIGLLVGTSYNLVDTFFVSRIGVDAISALSIVFPIQLILAGIATGVGVGSQSLISRLLGKNQKDKANQAAGNSIVLGFIFGIIVFLIGLFYSDDIISLFIRDPNIVILGSNYVRIILFGSFFLFYLRAALNIIRAQGNYLIPMVVLVFSAILNIILDPILIFGFWEIQAMGVEGAAIATVFSRMISCVIITIFLLSRKNEIKITLKGFKLNKKIIESIFIVGIPTIMIQLIMSITIAGTNKILEGLSIASIVIATVGIYFKLQSFVLTPLLGLNRTFVPIIGYNYGSKNYGRIREAVKIAVIYSFSISFIGFIIFQLFPGDLINIFSNDPNFINIGIEAFRRINLIFFSVGPAIIFISFFQGIGQGKKLFIILSLRQFIVFFPLLYSLTFVFGHPSLWFAFPIADAIALIVGLLLTIPDFKKLGFFDMIKNYRAKIISK